MSAHPNAYELLTKIIHLSTTPLPVKDKLEQMLQTINEAFEAEQTLLLRREKIVENGFLWRLALEKKPFWMGKRSSLLQEKVHPKEREFLRPPFACFPLYDKDTFQGILYVGFPKTRVLSPQE